MRKFGVPLVLLVLAGIVLMVWRLTSAPEAPAASADAARPPAEAASALAAAMAPPTRESAWEFCGASFTVPRPLDRTPPSSAAEVFALLPPEAGAQALAAARQRLLTSLQASVDVRARGAGIVLKDAAAATAAQRSLAGPAMARLARQSDDAVVMGWAVSLCQSAGGPDPCSGLDGSDWQALESDNAAASVALIVGEPDAKSEVMQTLPQAARYWLHAGQLTTAAIQATPSSEPGYLRLALALEAAAQEATLLEPLSKGAPDLCRPQPLAGTPAQRQCDALARLMLDSSDSLRTRAVGLKVAELAGWSAGRLATLRAEQDALAALSPAYDPQQPFSCASVEAGLRWFQDVAREGEPSSLRQRR